MTAPVPERESRFDRLAFARGVLATEAEALRLVAERLNDRFVKVVETIAACPGRVAVSGVGKSADIGLKIVGTFNSTGTRAYALDATRAVHGDLGMLHPDDTVLMISHSGESDELLRLLGPIRSLGNPLLAITGNEKSSLAKSAQAAIIYGPITEACPLALAPSSSTTVMLALGDAIAFTLLEQRQFTAEQFAKFHPAGTLGRKLAPVETVMRREGELRLADANQSVRTVFANARHTGRRTGAVMLVESDGSLAGLFTDSDLAKLFEAHADDAFDKPIREVMTRNPITVKRTVRVLEAIEILRDRKISELPVVDELGRPVGLLDITDLIGLEPAATTNAPPVLRLVGADGRTKGAAS